MFLPIERVKVVSSRIKLFLASCIKLFLTLSNDLLLARIDAIEALRCNLVSLLGPNAAGKTNILHILRIKLDLSIYCRSCVIVIVVLIV